MKGSSNLAIPALVIVILAALFATWMRLGSNDRLELGPYQALGLVTATETSRLLANQGSILLLTPDPGSDGDPVLQSQVNAFKSGLKQAGNVSIKAIEPIRMDPMTAMGNGGAVPAEQFHALLRKHTGIAAVVLFIGFPALDLAELNTFKATGLKCIVASAALPGYRRLLTEGYIHAALVPQPGTGDPAKTPPKTHREWFDQEYMLITRDTAARLAM